VHNHTAVRLHDNQHEYTYHLGNAGLRTKDVQGHELASCMFTTGSMGHKGQFHLVPASKQSTNLYDIHLMLCVQS
jgi:hypothetical protein